MGHSSHDPPPSDGPTPDPPASGGRPSQPEEHESSQTPAAAPASGETNTSEADGAEAELELKNSSSDDDRFPKVEVTLQDHDNLLRSGGQKRSSDPAPTPPPVATNDPKGGVAEPPGEPATRGPSDPPDRFAGWVRIIFAVGEVLYRPFNRVIEYLEHRDRVAKDTEPESSLSDLFKIARVLKANSPIALAFAFDFILGVIVVIFLVNHQSSGTDGIVVVALAAMAFVITLIALRVQRARRRAAARKSRPNPK